MFKMERLCSSVLNDSKNIDVLDYTPKDASYECVTPVGQIIVQIDEKFKVPVVILDFDECVTKFVRLQPHDFVQKTQFLDLERAPLSSPNMSTRRNSGYGSGYDTVLQLKN